MKFIHSLTNRLILTGILFIGSLIWAHTIIVSDHSFAYYMLPTRAWELLAGAIAALLAQARIKTKDLLSETLSALGMFAIIMSLIIVTESDPVPGLTALPVILGSALMIFSGIGTRTIIGKILSHRYLVAIGLVSYSAYLWHRPILAYLRYTLVPINIKIAMAVIIMTFVMATISYLFIEIPLRKNNLVTVKVFVGCFILPAIIVTAVALFVIRAINTQAPWIFPWNEITKLTFNVTPADQYSYNCQYRAFGEKAIYNEERCAFPPGIKHADTFLIGDSNAAHYLGMLRLFASHCWKY